jgi:hypothetical protein
VICANKEKTMSKLTQWLDHRMEVVGQDRLTDLAELSGVSLQTLRDLRAYGTLQMLNRSERRRLAAAFRVSLRKLEQLDAGELHWIEDGYVYDAIMPGRRLPPQDDDPASWLPQETLQEERGTPLVGRVRPSGQAQPDEDWQEEWGKRIPRRFGSGQNIYALELENSDRCVVLRNIPASEFREGQAAVYCWNGWEAQGWFGRVYLQPSKARVITPDGHRHDLDVLNIVRVGKLIGRWPPPEADLPRNAESV